MQRYQVQVSVFLIGSKETGETPNADPPAVADAVAQSILPTLAARTFSTGTTGFFASGKVTL